MLNRTKLSCQISRLASLIFPDLRMQSSIAKEKWDQISHDPSFVQKVEFCKSSFLIPGWYGNLNDAFDVEAGFDDYTVLSVDGSQIYPERNLSGAQCFLINIGWDLQSHLNEY